MAQDKRQKAVDLSHHISDVSRARQLSPLKGLAKYMNNPNVIAVAGGQSAVICPPCVLVSIIRLSRRHTAPVLFPVCGHLSERYAILHHVHTHYRPTYRAP